MRIISGKLKGKTISFLKSSITRPLKDSVKENIFNIIIHSNLLNVNIRNSKILDYNWKSFRKKKERYKNTYNYKRTD